MSYIIAEHQAATQENGASHKKVIFFSYNSHKK